MMRVKENPLDHRHLGSSESQASVCYVICHEYSSTSPKKRNMKLCELTMKNDSMNSFFTFQLMGKCADIMREPNYRSKSTSYFLEVSIHCEQHDVSAAIRKWDMGNGKWNNEENTTATQTS